MNRMYTGGQLRNQEAAIAKRQLIPTIAAFSAKRDRIARNERWRRLVYRAQVVGIVIVGALAAVGFCFLLVAGLVLCGVGGG